MFWSARKVTAQMVELFEKRATFRRLHHAGTFVIPNPWDIGSAKYLQHLGFPAIASSSAGFAWTIGVQDGEPSRDQVLEHLRQLCAAVDVPVNADFEAGFADTAEGVAQNVTLCVATGVAGISIEDFPGGQEKHLYSIDAAVARIRAAHGAIKASGADVVLVGRSEGFIRGAPDLDETIRRLRAYAEAGADCLYAPGLRERKHIAAVVQAVDPTPVNYLVMPPYDLTVSDLAELGVRRISIGGSLARAAWAGLADTAKKIADDGDFRRLADALPGSEIAAFLTKR